MNTEKRNDLICELAKTLSGLNKESHEGVMNCKLEKSGLHIKGQMLDDLKRDVYARIGVNLFEDIDMSLDRMIYSSWRIVEKMTNTKDAKAAANLMKQIREMEKERVERNRINAIELEDSNELSEIGSYEYEEIDLLLLEEELRARSGITQSGVAYVVGKARELNHINERLSKIGTTVIERSREGNKKYKNRPEVAQKEAAERNYLQALRDYGLTPQSRSRIDKNSGSSEPSPLEVLFTNMG